MTFYGYNDGYMGLGYYEEDLENQLRDSIEEQNLKKYKKVKQKITELVKEVQ